MSDKQAAGTPPDPRAIMELSTGYWASQALLTANRIGLFSVLAPGPSSEAEVAGRLGASARHTGLLLRACVGLGLLERTGDAYRNAPSAETFLVPGKPTYLGDALRYSDDLYATWGRLEESLKSGRPAKPAEDYTGRNPEQTRHFVRGMHNRALGIGMGLLSLVDLDGRGSMLDVGGGPGTYSALLARRYPQLRPTVMDLPDVVAIAAEIIAEMGLTERVATLPGDYKRSDFPHGQDVVLISGVFHRESEATCRGLIERGRDALRPGGLVIVSDVFTDETGTAPAFATLFGVNMMLTAEDGGVHSTDSVALWMRDAGLAVDAVKAFPPPMPHRLVEGRRP